MYEQLASRRGYTHADTQSSHTSRNRAVRLYPTRRRGHNEQKNRAASVEQFTSSTRIVILRTSSIMVYISTRYSHRVRASPIIFWKGGGGVVEACDARGAGLPHRLRVQTLNQTQSRQPCCAVPDSPRGAQRAERKSGVHHTIHEFV